MGIKIVAAPVLAIIGALVLVPSAAFSLNNGNPWTEKANLVTANSCRTPFVHPHSQIRGNVEATLTPQRSSHDTPLIAAIANVRNQTPFKHLDLDAFEPTVVNGKITGCTGPFLIAEIVTNSKGTGKGYGSTSLPQGDNTQVVRLAITDPSGSVMLISPSWRI